MKDIRLKIPCLFRMHFKNINIQCFLTAFKIMIIKKRNVT